MLDWIFEGHSDLGGQRDDPDHGCHLRGVHRGAGHGHDRDGEYFPFAVGAYTIIQYTAWALLFLGGGLADIPAPSAARWRRRRTLLPFWRGARFSLFNRLCKKPIFSLALDIARAPYTALMDSRWIPAILPSRGSSRRSPMG